MENTLHCKLTYQVGAYMHISVHSVVKDFTESARVLNWIRDELAHILQRKAV